MSAGWTNPVQRFSVPFALPSALYPKLRKTTDREFPSITIESHNVTSCCDLSPYRTENNTEGQVRALRCAELPTFRRVDCLLAVMLQGNNLTSFHALHICRTIKYIDVSFNSIGRVPSDAFFKGNPGPADLEILLCDHNHIFDWESSRLGLSSADSLAVLTLEANPIACCINYRRILVNAVPHLRLLDSHPIAEEEHIEGANFSFTRYAAPALCELKEHVNTRWGCQTSLGLRFAVVEQPTTALIGKRLLEFTKLIYKLLSTLNGLLSPCTTIQRAFRAYRTWHPRGVMETRRPPRNVILPRVCALERTNAARCIQATVRRYIVKFSALANLWLLMREERT